MTRLNSKQTNKKPDACCIGMTTHSCQYFCLFWSKFEVDCSHIIILPHLSANYKSNMQLKIMKPSHLPSHDSIQINYIKLIPNLVHFVHRMSRGHIQNSEECKNQFTRNTHSHSPHSTHWRICLHFKTRINSKQTNKKADAARLCMSITRSLIFLSI